MNIEINFELTEPDLQYFRNRFEEARYSTKEVDQQELIDSVRALVNRGLAANSPEFVLRQVAGLDRVLNMLEDETWQIPEEERKRVEDMLAYFVEPSDIVADDVPVLGLIDDAIAISLVLLDLQHQIEAYEEFEAYRDAEMERRKNRGQPTDVSKEDWLADRRAALHSRMRERHSQSPSGWRYTTF